MAATFLFYVFAGLTLLGGIVLLATRNVLYSAYSLMATLLGIAGLYVVLGADFVGTTQIIVYVGGVLVLMLFGVMLTNRISGKQIVSDTHNRFAGVFLGMLVFGGLTWAILRTPWPAASAEGVGETIQPMGKALMTDYLLAFELVGVLLLVVLVGAVYIAKLTATLGKKDQA